MNLQAIKSIYYSMKQIYKYSEINIKFLENTHNYLNTPSNCKRYWETCVLS